MAIITRVEQLDPKCTVKMSYDDVALKLVSIDIDNQGKGKCDFYFADLNMNKKIESGAKDVKVLADAEKQTIKISTKSKDIAKKTDIPQIENIVWRATYYGF